LGGGLGQGVSSVKTHARGVGAVLLLLLSLQWTFKALRLLLAGRHAGYFVSVEFRPTFLSQLNDPISVFLLWIYWDEGEVTCQNGKNSAGRIAPVVVQLGTLQCVRRSTKGRAFTSEVRHQKPLTFGSAVDISSTLIGRPERARQSAEWCGGPPAPWSSAAKDSVSGAHSEKTCVAFPFPRPTTKRSDA